MLFRPEAFEPLSQERWDEERVRREIRAIVADAEKQFDPVSLWPAEEWDAWGSPTPLTGLYCGAAGVVWALDALRRGGHADVGIDLAAAVQRALERTREAPELSEAEDFELPRASAAALFSGETGVLVVAWRVGGGASLEPLLEERILESRESHANEVMWEPREPRQRGDVGRAGRAAGRTGAPRLDGRRALGASLEDDGRRGVGGARRGRAVDAAAVREDEPQLRPRPRSRRNRPRAPRRGDLLTPHRRQRLVADTVRILERNAVREDGFVNWPPGDGGPLEGGDGDPRLQWCHGAPGIVISAADILPEELLLAGAELTWRAGPHELKKGASICHGTAGNGYAFLKAFERTGDEQWLERARRFAVHALGQVERRGTGRYSLFTGDLGVAVYAADCLDGTTRYPVLETWE